MSGKHNWYDRVNDTYAQGIANLYMQEVPLDVFNIFPEVSSAKLTGKIAKYDKEDWFYIGTISDYIRKGAVESAGDDYETSPQDYTIKPKSFHKDITKEEAAEYDNPFDPISDATKFVLNRLRRVIMQQFVNTYITTSVWSDDLVGGTSDFVKWNAGSTAIPIDNVITWQQTVQKTTGFKPNRLCVSADVHAALKTCPQITDAMKTTSDKIVTTDLLARLFEVDSYVVMDTVNSGATDFMTSGKILLCYTPNAPSKMAPSAGYTLTYRGQGIQANSTRQIPMPLKNDAFRIECDVYAEPIILASDLGIYAHTAI